MKYLKERLLDLATDVIGYIKVIFLPSYTYEVSYEDDEGEGSTTICGTALMTEEEAIESLEEQLEVNGIESNNLRLTRFELVKG